ncbi:phage minor capsid protein [Paenibacillus sp. FSL W7-1279]|uniref:phage minor capsid protein n=1 Tax=Paenibacillus sp. FSL W7-1279 TaxID=2921697 RepID=UPI0030DCD0DD
MADTDKLIALYSHTGERLLELIRTLESGSYTRRRKERILKQIDEILAELTDGAAQSMSELLAESYKAGSQEAASNLIAQGMPENQVNTALEPIIHQQAVQAIMDDAFFRILEATDNMSQDAKRRVEEIVRTATERMLTEGVSRREATNEAVAKMTEQGITGIVAKNGARIPADKYMNGVVQYNLRKAHVTGAENTIVQNGLDLVYVNYVGITCEYCAKYQGRVYSISGNDSRFPKLEIRPPYHAHCVHSISAWIEEYQSPDEVERMLAASNRPFTDNRTESNIRRYNEIQRDKARKNETRKQWLRYKAVLPKDTPDLRTFARLKARNAETYRELQGSYRQANRIINERNNPFRSAESASIQRFESYIQGADTFYRKDFAELLLNKAGLGHISVSIDQNLNANGACMINFGGERADVSAYRLLRDDGRPFDYQTKTALHEFYHANMHGLKHDVYDLGMKEWLKLEETATETAAHFMADLVGVSENLAYSYSGYLVETLPKLKRLDEFSDAVTVKDFGRKFMKYRFDNDFKTAEWRPLKDQIDKITIEMGDYAQYYKSYVFEHEDEIVKKIFDNISDSTKQFNRENYITAIKNSLNAGWKNYDFSQPGFTDSLIIAMNDVGVK